MMTLDDIREVLRESFHATADWRKRKAQEYPDDNRHVEAAAALERLAESVRCVPDAILSAYGQHFVGPAESFNEAEIHNEALRQIGIHTQPENAEAFVKGYLRQMTISANDDANQANDDANQNESRPQDLGFRVEALEGQALAQRPPIIRVKR